MFRAILLSMLSLLSSTTPSWALEIDQDEVADPILVIAVGGELPTDVLDEPEFSNYVSYWRRLFEVMEEDHESRDVTRCHAHWLKAWDASMAGDADAAMFLLNGLFMDLMHPPRDWDRGYDKDDPFVELYIGFLRQQTEGSEFEQFMIFTEDELTSISNPSAQSRMVTDMVSHLAEGRRVVCPWITHHGKYESVETYD